MLDFENPRHSWVVNILPYLERSDISDAWSLGSVISKTPGATDASDPGYPNHDEGMNQSLNEEDNYALSHKSPGFVECPSDRDAWQDGGLSYVVNCGYIEPDVEHSWYRSTSE
jgi:hypothetical protein